MRLIECYIDNFGKLSDERISFTEGLNTVCRENGWGKTTLSAFIKAMFYSLEETRKQSLDENDRKRYTPWHGGRFGGSLTIAVGKKLYRIERSFAQKSADDTFALYDLETGRLTGDYSERIGEELFGIDADGFERTVFLSEKNISEKNDNKSISAKLSDLVGTDGDVGVLDDALALLDTRRKFYYKKGGAGEIGRIEGEIARLHSEISLFDGLKLKCRENEAAITEREAELRALYKERERLGLVKERTAQISHRADMKEKLDRKLARLSELEGYFGERIPSSEDISAVRRKSIEAQQLKAQRGADNSEYERLSELFGSTTDYQALEEMTLVADRYESGRRSLGGAPHKNCSEELQKKADEYLEKLQNSVVKSNTGVGVSLLLLSVVLSAIAVMLGFLVTPYLYALLVPAVVLIIAAVALLSRKKPDSALEEEAREFLVGANADLSYGNIIDALRAFRSSLGTALREREAQLTRVREDEARLVEFLSKFPSVDYLNYQDGVRRIMALYSKYYALESAKRTQDEAGRERAAEAARLEGEVNAFLTEFHLTSVYAISELEEKISEHTYLKREVARAKVELSEFDTKYGTDKLDPLPTLPQNVDEKIAERERYIALLKRQYDTDIETLESEDQKRASLEELERRLVTYKTNLSVIQKTSTLLEEAKDAMTSRYLGGTKAGFERYVKEISGECGEYTVDTSFTVAKSERGSSKKAEAYSRGTRELYSLAMRLALIDSLYENESPFVMLDDPFVSFDDEKVARALKLIRNIAKHRQVIYLTCSAHRTM